MKYDKKAFNVGLKRLIAIMKQEGHKQRDIAYQFGISESMLSYYTAGRRELSLGTQVLIAERIGLTYQKVIDFK